MEIKYDKHSLIIDGKRVFLRCGAFHYFRTPGKESALDRFSKMKSAGYNAVDIYFNWNYHSQKESECDFSEFKNVRDVLDAAREVGLYVVVRPGPFINAEVNAGGIPFWLLGKKDVVPRCRIGTEYHYSKEYIDYVKKWYDIIIPIVNEYDNVLLFQIENEYATDTMEEDYMRELYEMARSRGIKCPIIHNDAYSAGLWADVVDIYATDIYPYINPNQNWREDNFCFDTLDNIEENVRSFSEHAPIYIAEMQSGWFDKWDGSGYEYMRKALGDEHINIMTKTALAQGVTAFNHYMAIGGTSWGNLACDEVYTSYEFCAPIDEYGIIRDNFYKAKEINYFLNSFGFVNTEMIECKDYGEGIYAKIRHDNENGCDWFFLRNMGTDEKTVEGVTLKPFDMKICAKNLPLLACSLDFSGVEIFARLKDENKEVLFMISDEKNSFTVDGVEHSGTRKDFENLKFRKNGNITEFVFLTKKTANKTWILDGKKAIFNADYVYPTGIKALEKTGEIAYFDLKNGFSKTYYKVQSERVVETLKHPDVTFCAPEIDADYDYSSWKKIDGKTDALSCEMYDEFVFYKAQIPNFVEELTLSARHLFAVYVNGKEVLSRNSYKLEKLQEVPETISVNLNKGILNKDKNELTILVQNLGFDKGFSGDTNYPRGLVEFSTVPEVDVKFAVNEKLSIERDDLTESDNAYLAKLTYEFDDKFEQNVVAPMYVYLKKFNSRRATILLNGFKIGRYIKRQNVQDKFYLPKAFLKNGKNKIEIVVWTKDRNIGSSWDFKTDLKSFEIEVGQAKRFQLF